MHNAQVYIHFIYIYFYLFCLQSQRPTTGNELDSKTTVFKVSSHLFFISFGFFLVDFQNTRRAIVTHNQNQNQNLTLDAFPRLEIESKWKQCDCFCFCFSFSFGVNLSFILVIKLNCFLSFMRVSHRECVCVCVCFAFVMIKSIKWRKTFLFRCQFVLVGVTNWISTQPKKI